jgi:uncharacterized membrane protein
MIVEPSHRLMMMYDIHPGRYEQYYRYMLSEFVPVMQDLGLKMEFAWRVFSESYPERQVDFVAKNVHVLSAALQHESFHDAEVRLQTYTVRYQRKIVRFENRCQF